MREKRVPLNIRHPLGSQRACAIITDNPAFTRVPNW